MSTTPEVEPQRGWLWPVVVSSAVLVTWVIKVALLLIPQGDRACPAIYPAPPGCFTDTRIPSALLMAVLMVAFFTVQLWWSSRRRGALAPSWAATAVFTVTALLTYGVVLSS